MVIFISLNEQNQIPDADVSWGSGGGGRHGPLGAEVSQTASHWRLGFQPMSLRGRDNVCSTYYMSGTLF